MKNDVFAGFVATDSYDFGISKDDGAEFVGEVVRNKCANFFVLVRKEARGGFGDKNFDAEAGKIGSDFATGRATADDHNSCWFATEGENVVWSVEFSGSDAGNFGYFGVGSSSDDESIGRVFFVANGDGVGVKKVSRTFEADYAGLLERILKRSLQSGGCLLAMRNDRSGAKRKILIFKFGATLESGVIVSKIKSYAKRDIAQFEI